MHWDVRACYVESDNEVNIAADEQQKEGGGGDICEYRYFGRETLNILCICLTNCHAQIRSIEEKRTTQQSSKLASFWNLTSRQPHRVTSGRITL